MEAAYTAGSLVLQYYVQTSMKHSDQDDYRIDGAHGFHEVGPPLDQPLIWNTKQWDHGHASRSNPAKSMHVSHIIGGHGRSTRGGRRRRTSSSSSSLSHHLSTQPSPLLSLSPPVSQRQTGSSPLAALHAHARVPCVEPAR